MKDVVLVPDSPVSFWSDSFTPIYKDRKKNRGYKFSPAGVRAMLDKILSTKGQLQKYIEELSDAEHILTFGHYVPIVLKDTPEHREFFIHDFIHAE